MNKIKSILLLLLCFITLTGFTFSENSSNLLEEKIINTYLEGLESIQYNENNKFISSLSRENELNNYTENYDRHIETLRDNFSDNELKENYNYSDSQIFAIRNYDYSETMRIQAAATITANMYLSSYYYNSSQNKTYLTVGVSMNYSGAGHSIHARNVALSIGGSEARYFYYGHSFSGTYKSGTKTYYRGSTGQEIHNGQGILIGYNEQYVVSTDGGWTHDYYYLQTASASYTAVAGGKVTVSGYEGAILGGVLSAGFGASFSGNGIGISIVPYWNWTKIRNFGSKTVFL